MHFGFQQKPSVFRHLGCRLTVICRNKCRSSASSSLRYRMAGKTTGRFPLPISRYAMKRIEIVGKADVPWAREVRGAAREWQPYCPDLGVIGFIDTKETSMRALWNRASIRWCRMFHPEPLWPVHGQYRCPVCLRSYAVPWQEGDVLRGRKRSRTYSSNRRRGFAVFAFQKDRG